MILPIFQGSVFSNIFICCISESTLVVRHSNKNDRSVLPMDFMITLPSAKPVGLLAKRCHEYHDFTWCSTWIGQVRKRSVDSYCVNETYQVQEIPWAKYCLRLRHGNIRQACPFLTPGSAYCGHCWRQDIGLDEVFVWTSTAVIMQKQ